MHWRADDLQCFADAIVRGHTAPAGCVTSAAYTVAGALAIYRNNYSGNLRDALAGAYPVVEQIVGEEFFRILARSYVAQYPSRNANLHHYGAEMGAFIADFPAAKTLPYLAHVAALEWACHCAYFAADVPPLDVAALAQVPEADYPSLTFMFHPACDVVRAPYPIVAIWQAHQSGAPRDFCIDLASGPSIALVSRVANEVQVNALDEASHLWLEGLRKGLTIGMATDLTVAQCPEFDLQATLLNFVSRNVITNFAPR